MKTLAVNKSLEFCRLFCAVHNLVSVRQRFQDILSHRAERNIDSDSFLQLFAIAPDLAHHVFKLFDYYRRNAINYNNFLLAFSMFTNSTNEEKVDLIRDIFCDLSQTDVYKPELVHIVDLVIDSACNLMGINVHDPAYIVNADRKAKEIAEDLIDGDQPGQDDGFFHRISLEELYHRVETHRTFSQLREFVLETAYNSINFPRSCHMPLKELFALNDKFAERSNGVTSSSGSLDNRSCIHRFLFPEYCSSWHTDESTDCLKSVSSDCSEGTCGADHRDGPCLVADPIFDDDGVGRSGAASIAMQGYVYKQSWFLKRLKRRWVVIRNNMLYSYHNHTSAKPNIVLSLSDAVCGPVRDEGLPRAEGQSFRGRPRFAFHLKAALCHIIRIVYLHTAEQRDRWVEAIRIASQNFKLHEHYRISSVVHPCLPNVFECKGARTGEHYVLKYIDKYMIRDTDLHALRIESGVLRFIDSPDIAQTIALYEDTEKIYLIRRYIPNWVRLDEIIIARAVLSVNSVGLIMRQILSGLAFLLEHHLTLGAFGPANVVLRLDSLRNHRVQMVDIGLRKFFVARIEPTSREYVAPEIERGDRYGPKADLWSVGAIIFRLLTPGSSSADIDAAKQGRLDLSRTQGPKCVINTLRRLLNRNPSKRYHAAVTMRVEFIKSAVERPLRMCFPKSSDSVRYLLRRICAECTEKEDEESHCGCQTEAGECEDTDR